MTAAEPRPRLVVGLVGGVASGKSTVARIFEELGLRRIDADAEARAAVARPAVAAAIRARFGDGVFRRDGGLDRDALARIVFADPRARADLEAITHPPVRAAIERRLTAAAEDGAEVLLDVPLLFEGGLSARCDGIVFVEAPEEIRVARARRRGWDRDELRRREATQLPLAVKKARATATIDNAEDLDHTRDQVSRLLASWRNVRPAPRAEPGV